MIEVRRAIKKPITIIRQASAKELSDYEKQKLVKNENVSAKAVSKRA